MDLEDIFKISEGKIINGNISNKKFNKIRTNSKEIEEGDIFVCLKGKNKDGHNYIDDVIDKCVCIIVSIDVLVASKTLVIKVKDTIEFLNSLAYQIRKKYINVPLIAITGSVGKTTTKELLKHVLSQKYNVLYSKKSNNNNIGVPLTLFELNNSYNMIILEMGMNHLNEINYLSKTALPNSAIITNIGTSHIGNLKNKKNILRAKLEITEGLNNGNLILNSNDRILKKIKRNKDNVIYDIKEFKVNNIITTIDHLFFNIKYKNKIYNVKFNIPNVSLINNILLVIKTSLIYKMKMEEILNRIETFQSINGRNNIIKLSNNSLLVDDCYNSCYESVISSLNMIKNLKEEKIIILGDILELGKHSKKVHLKIGLFLKKYQKEKKDLIITLGNNTKLIKKYCKCISFDNNEEIKKYLNEIQLSNKCIFLKASRKMHLEEIKEYLIKKINE